MQLLIWKDDYDTLIYEFETDHQKANAVLDIIEKRIELGYFSYPDDAERKAHVLAKQVEITGNYREALQFLLDRSMESYEYETIQMKETVRI